MRYDLLKAVVPWFIDGFNLFMAIDCSKYASDRRLELSTMLVFINTG